MTEIKVESANKIIGLITLLAVIAAITIIVIILKEGSRSHFSAGSVSDSITRVDSIDSSENRIAAGLHNLLIGQFERDSDGMIIYPEEFCGDYIAEDGLHVVLVSIDGGITSRYNDYFQGYLNMVYYEQGKIPYSDMLQYCEIIRTMSIEEGFSSCEAEIDISKGGIVLSVQPQSVDNLRKFVDEIVGKGELKNLSSSNVTVVELE
ncbi:MAG: hypothetical protein K5848_05255 [Lachnospiraceae bacterium]|nr:hypothetical protein [Lachnospiraceae bacterium]